MIYQNKRAITLHLVSLLSLAMSIFVNYMIFSDLNHFFSEFQSKTSGIFWMILMLLLGHSILITFFWLSGKYVLEIKYDKDDKKTILINTWTIWGIYRSYKQSKVILKTASYQRGKSHFSHAPSVNAPWYKLKTEQGKTLVVDLQGLFHEQF